MHADIRRAGSSINQCKGACEDDYLIVCGDFGAEYGNRNHTYFKEQISYFPGVVIVLRGNHDNRYWEKHYLDSTYVGEWCDIIPNQRFNDSHFIYEKEYPNIWYTRDEGDIINLNGYNFLFLPGAYSIDKDFRLDFHYPYNYKEQMTKAEMSYMLLKVQETLESNSKIDFIISHTFPHSWESAFRDLFLAGVDQSKVDKSTEDFLDNIEKILDNNYIH